MSKNVSSTKTRLNFTRRPYALNCTLQIMSRPSGLIRDLLPLR
jgi:hypothetical protein